MDSYVNVNEQHAIRIGTDNVQVIVKVYASREEVESWLKKIESSPHAVKLEAYEGQGAVLQTGQVLVQTPLDEPLNVPQPSEVRSDSVIAAMVGRTLLGVTMKGNRGLNL